MILALGALADACKGGQNHRLPRGRIRGQLGHRKQGELGEVFAGVDWAGGGPCGCGAGVWVGSGAIRGWAWGACKWAMGSGVGGPGLIELADWPKPIWLGHRAALTAKGPPRPEPDPRPVPDAKEGPGRWPSGGASLYP